MNNNSQHIDNVTKDLFGKAGIEKPGNDFTKNIMSQILKDPHVNVSFITKDDKKSNIWLVLSIAIMFVGSFVFYFIKHGFSFENLGKDIHAPSFITYFADYFSKFWNEISLSPYIIIALAGIIFLVVIDRTIVRYLYSI